MGTEITTYDKQWATQAQAYAEKEKASANFISTRGGILRLGEDEFEGNQMCVIILHSVFENTYYGSRYDPDNIIPPICYAMAENDDDLAPHPAMAKDPGYFKPQAEDCASCPMNEFGTSDTGKGKACANRRRIAVIPAGVYSRRKGSKGEFDLDIFDEEDHYAQADMYFLKLPVMSGREYAKFVKSAASEHARPPYGVLARVYIEDDVKAQFKIKFELLDVLPDEMFPVIDARHKEAAKSLMQPYSPPDEEETGAKSKKTNLARLRK